MEERKYLLLKVQRRLLAVGSRVKDHEGTLLLFLNDTLLEGPRQNATQSERKVSAAVTAWNK